MAQKAKDTKAQDDNAKRIAFLPGDDVRVIVRTICETLNLSTNEAVNLLIKDGVRGVTSSQEYKDAKAKRDELAASMGL